MKKLKSDTKKLIYAILWMSPAIFLVIFATIYPLIFSIDYSLYDSTIFQKVKFIGFDNYIKLFKDERFMTNVINSLIFTFGSLALAYVSGLVITVLLRKPTKFHKICRTILLIPWVTNEVVYALLWQWILNPQMSPVYYYMKQAGIQLPLFLSNTNYVLATLMVLNALRSLGFAIVMLLAAFSGIPYEAEESALIDGCGKIQNLWYIILPLIKPVSLVMLIVMTISNFNTITLVLTMTGGGPVYASEIIPVRLYKEGFIFFNVDTASTMTTLMLIVNLSFAAIYKKLISAKSYY